MVRRNVPALFAKIHIYAEIIRNGLTNIGQTAPKCRCFDLSDHGSAPRAATAPRFCHGHPDLLIPAIHREIFRILSQSDAGC